MSSRSVAPVAFGLVMGAAVGGAATFFVFGGAASDSGVRVEAKSERAPGPGPQAADASASVEPSEPAAPEFEATRTTAPIDRSSAPGDVVERVTAAARSAPLPAVRRGTRSIRGRVVDREGAPLAGAILRATRQVEPERAPTRSRTGESAPPAESLDDAVRGAVQSWYEKNGDRRETTSDGQGAYELPELREGRWTVQAWSDGWTLEALGDTTVMPDATLDFSAAPVVRVEVAVLLPDGSPAPGAAIQVKRRSDRNPRRTEAWSRATPLVALTSGEWELKATLGDPDQGPSWPEYLASKPLLVSLASGVEPPACTLRLEGAPGIRGEIRDLGRTPRRQLVVKYQALAAGATPDLKAMARAQDNTQVWVNNGRYAFKDLAPGRYLVGASRGWNERIAAHAVVEVGQGMVVQDLEIPALDPRWCVVVRAKDPAGRPLDDVTFTVQAVRGGQGLGGGNAATERQLDGSYWVPLDRFDNQYWDGNAQADELDLTKSWPSDLKVTLWCWSARYGSKSAEIASSTRTLELLFGEPAMLVAAVAGYAESGYAGRLSLSIERIDPGGSNNYWGGGDDKVGSDGTQKLGPVEPGAWRLSLWVQQRGGNQWERTLGSTIDVTLAPGENRASIALPALHTLIVEVPGAPRTSVQLNPSGNAPRGRSFNNGQRQTDASGRVTFEDVPAGEYVVTLRGGSGGTMKVTVPAGGPVRFESTPENALVVYVNKNDGRLAGAGFKNRDMIVAVDGKEYATAAELQSALSARLSSSSIALSLVRDGKPFDLTIDGAVFTNPFEMGGSVQIARR
jgi:hypothetical protein